MPWNSIRLSCPARNNCDVLRSAVCSLWLFVVITLVVVGTMASSQLTAQVISTKASDEPITLDLDNSVTKRLIAIEDFVAEKQWDVVATMLRQTQAEKSDKLVAISPEWYVSVARYCQCRAAILPTAGLITYQQQINATAQKWIVDAEQQREHTALLKIVRQTFASSSGDLALNRLAARAFEAGDIATARTWWEMLLPASGALRSAAGIGLLRHPDSTSNVAQLRAHLVLCSLFAGDIERAESELVALRRLHADAVGQVAGRDGVLADLLKDEINNADLRNVDRGSISPPVLPTPELDQRLWSIELPWPTWINKENNGKAADFGDLFPAVANNVAFISNGESVFAFDLQSGRPKWSDTVPENNQRVDVDPQHAVIHTLADPVAPKLPTTGRPQQTLTLFGDRLYARLGTPITSRAKQELHAQSELIGLDIGEGEGRLAWRVSADDVDPQDPLQATAPWSFDGSPVADSRRVFAVLRRNLPQEQINVACFDAETARLLWNRRIGVTVAATEETVNSTTHLRLTLAEESLFLSTDSGAIAALDTQDGLLRWLRTYHADASHAVHDRRHAGSIPPHYRDGVLYVAPLDCSLIMAIHAESGLRLWQHEWPDPIQHIVGISGETLVVSGRSLWGINIANGKSAWPQRRVGENDPEGFSVGRGLLIGNEVWWPNREELIVVNATDGQIQRRVRLRESIAEPGGHLFAAGPFVLMSRANRLTVFGEKDAEITEDGR